MPGRDGRPGTRGHRRPTWPRGTDHREPGWFFGERSELRAPSLGRTVTLTLSARGIRAVDVRGIEAVAADLLARG